MVGGKAVNNPTDNRRCPNAIAIWTYDEKKEDAEPVHWARKFYDSLKEKGVEIHEERFDDPITRGEVFALLDQVVK